MTMIWIYCKRTSNGAKILAEAIRSLGQECRRTRRVPRTGNVVSWGERLENALNGRVRGNKEREMMLLHQAGVRTPDVFDEAGDGRLGRLKHHHSGRDLVNPPEHPDFWVQKLRLTKEFRVHVFRDKSIRLGLKVKAREDAHDWIRTHEQGWRFDYGLAAQEAYIPGVRDQAKRAVKALGYDFGAVDVAIGLPENEYRPGAKGRVYVLEVNSAPGLDNIHTAEAYAKHIVEVF